jgi:hypothetical protein
MIISFSIFSFRILLMDFLVEPEIIHVFLDDAMPRVLSVWSSSSARNAAWLWTPLWLLAGTGGAVHGAAVVELLWGGAVHGAVILGLLWVTLAEGRAVV